jgi:hypothetical protein
MHLPQLNISMVLTCFLLVYALVPPILIENVTPVDDICNFTYPLHCGQPFMDNASPANETVHEVPLYIHTCSSYICFTHLFQFILITRYYLFHHHNPLFMYQQSNPDRTDATIHSTGGTSHTHLSADDVMKVHMSNPSCFITMVPIHEYSSHCSQITTFGKLCVLFQITTPA